jgi:hypothetical protein
MKLNWEKIKNSNFGWSGDTYRAKVFGGWLVAAGGPVSITFIPDPTHQWDGNSLD